MSLTHPSLIPYLSRRRVMVELIALLSELDRREKMKCGASRSAGGSNVVVLADWRRRSQQQQEPQAA